MSIGKSLRLLNDLGGLLDQFDWINADQGLAMFWRLKRVWKIV